MPGVFVDGVQIAGVLRQIVQLFPENRPDPLAQGPVPLLRDDQGARLQPLFKVRAEGFGALLPKQIQKPGI